MSGNAAGAALLAAAMTAFNAGDTFVKLLSERLPVQEVICLRNLLSGLALLLLWAMRRVELDPRHLLNPYVLARALLDTATTLLPLAEAVTILAVSPVLSTALAGLVLGERVGGARWAAVLAGFLGVLLVIQPTAIGWRHATLLPLAAACIMAVADIVTRRIPAGIAPASIVLTNIALVALAAGVWSLAGWRPAAVSDLGPLALAALFLLGGYLLYIMAFRRGEVSYVAAFKYAGLPAAALLGWLVWGHRPDRMALLGAALIVASGLLVLRGERPVPAG